MMLSAYNSYSREVCALSWRRDERFTRLGQTILMSALTSHSHSSPTHWSPSAWSDLSPGTEKWRHSLTHLLAKKLSLSLCLCLCLSLRRVHCVRRDLPPAATSTPAADPIPLSTIDASADPSLISIAVPSSRQVGPWQQGRHIPGWYSVAEETYSSYTRGLLLVVGEGGGSVKRARRRYSDRTQMKIGTEVSLSG